LALRPERIRIYAGETVRKEANFYRATIQDRVYIGDSRQYRVVVEGGQELIAREPNIGGRGFAKGENVIVSWEAEDVRVVHVDEKERK
jgi:ABC-type Fe3+/spermidine/putrescine transport system ATPase subunit